MAHLFIIAGHGAGDSGAVGNGYTEAERVRSLASRIATLGGDGVTVGDTSRNWYRDNGISRLNIPKDWQILELHMDSASASARGGHVIIKSGFAPDVYDNALASLIGGMFPGRSKLIVGRSDLANVNRAAKKGYGYRLMECGFISNAGDVQTFNSRMDELARGILGTFGIGCVPGTLPKAEVKPVVDQTATSQASGSGTDAGIKFTYAVKTEDEKVLPEVTNLADYAGIRGKKIIGIAVKCNKGSLWYQAHVLGGGWLPKVNGYDWNDHDNGYAGNGKPIDAVRVYYNTPDDIVSKHGYQKAQYRVSPVSQNYYDWQFDDETDNGQDGYAGGFGKAIDRFQLF